jgi:DNA-binding transcriptional ArsR family regulator
MAPDGEPAWQPAATRVVDSADAIKALADPLRLRLLRLLMVASDRSWSVKEIAAELDQPVTKLYHHIKLLEGAALITDVESRLVSGIVEHRYRGSQKQLRFDDSLFGVPEARPAAIAHIAALIDNTRDDLVSYLNQDDADADQVSVWKSTARLTADEVETFTKTIGELAESFVRHRDDPAYADLPRTSLLVVLNPLEPDAIG